MISAFPEVFDSSMLATFKSCPQLFKKIYIDQWKPKDGANVHLTAGGAFAKGVEVARLALYTGEYDRGIFLDPKEPGGKPQRSWVREKLPSPADAETAVSLGLQALVHHYGDFECPADSPKSLERVAGALEFYFARYPLSHNAAYPVLLSSGRRAIEVNFAEPLPISHPETDQPLIYCGRGDAIVLFAGDNYLCDEKTTTSLGPTWSRQWDMRSQFLGYTWGFRKSLMRIAGVLVRGVSILKTKYDTQEAIANFSDFECDRWYRELIEWLEDIKICYKTGRWRYNLDHACAEYGGCAFKTACKSEDERPWLEQYFERRHWDPLTRIETQL